MRTHHAIVVVALILIGLGLKLTLFSAPAADADTRAVESLHIDVSQLQQDTKNLPEQKAHDMTFVFSKGD
jgi:hypothetical protein